MVDEIKRMQQRRDTAANWESANPTLLDGEIGFDRTARRIKVGDGVTPWSDLSYADAAEQAEIAVEMAEAAAQAAQDAADMASEITGLTGEDAAVALLVNTDGTATQDALTAAMAPLAPRDLAYAGHQAAAEASRIIRAGDDDRATLTPDGRTEAVIIDGGSTQIYSVSSCTPSDDTTRFKHGTQSKRFSTSGAATAWAIHSPASVLTHGPATHWRTWVWIDDITALTGHLELEVYRGAIVNTVAPPADERWRRQVPVGELHTGWNLIESNTLPTTAPGVITPGMYDTPGWGHIYSMRMIWQTTRATGINLGKMWLECPRRASMIFVADGGYRSFANLALPELRSRGIPVTWAIQPANLGIDIGQSHETVTMDDLVNYAAAGDDISMHTYAGEITSTMSRAEIRDDALHGIAALTAAGNLGRGHLFRAAWMQNNAPNHAAAQPYFAAYATATVSNAHDSTIDTWPPMDRYDIKRCGLHYSDTSFIDDVFEMLEKTHGLLVGYTHGIDAAGGADMTPARLAYVLGKIDAALAAGWLECVTFTQLVARGGGVLRAS